MGGLIITILLIGSVLGIPVGLICCPKLASLVGCTEFSKRLRKVICEKLASLGEAVNADTANRGNERTQTHALLLKNNTYTNYQNSNY